MKRIGLLAVLMFAVAAAPAQVKFGAGPHAGFSFASFPKPADELYGFGFGFGAHGDVSLMKYLTLRLNFNYHMFSSDKSAFKFVDQNGNPVTGVSVEGATASIFGITVDGLGKLPLGGVVTPYALLGFGIHILGVSDASVTYQGQSVGSFSTDSKTKFGINFGAGAEFAISKTVSLYGEVKYVLIFTSEETDPQTGQKSGGTTGHIPITFGATFWF